MYDSDSSNWQTPSEKSVPNSPKYPDSGNSDSDYASSVAILGEDGKLTSRECQRRFDYNLRLYCGSSGHMVRHCPKPQVRERSDYSGSDSDSDPDSDSDNSGSNHNSGSSNAESVTSVSDHRSVHSNPGSVQNSGSKNSDSDPVSGYSESDSESDDSDSEDSN